jgi:hypothetical protein
VIIASLMFRSKCAGLEGARKTYRAPNVAGNEGVHA